MRSNSKHTVEELEKYIHMYLYEDIHYKVLKEAFGLLLSQSFFTQKVLRYQVHGLKGIEKNQGII